MLRMNDLYRSLLYYTDSVILVFAPRSCEKENDSCHGAFVRGRLSMQAETCRDALKGPHNVLPSALNLLACCDHKIV
jgi:hypothetical protein